MKGKVSVIIAAYNNEKTITNAIKSILNQTYDNWECIICDDASTDRTWDIVCEFKNKYAEKIIGIKNGFNYGPAYSRNRCIDIACGEYIAIQDADDESFHNRLERQVNFLNLNTDVSVVGTYANLVDNKGKTWGINRPSLEPLKEHWIKGSQVIHASTMIRKSHIVNVGNYDEHLRFGEDYDLFLKLISKGYKIVTIPEVLYKIHMDKKDYKKKILRARLLELRVKKRALKSLNIPIKNYIFLLKPLFLGVVPKRLLFFYHAHKFKNQNLD